MVLIQIWLPQIQARVEQYSLGAHVYAQHHNTASFCSRKAEAVHQSLSVYLAQAN